MPQAKFRKPVLAPGIYETPTGSITITPERVQHFADSFKAMRAAGIMIPVPWGHQPKADPVNETDLAKSEFHKSRYNATYVDSLEVDPKSSELTMVANVPPGFSVAADGNLVDSAGGTAIAEVSAAICDWQDGKGKKWPDSIRHVALTPLPVVHGLEGFTPVTDGGVPGEVRLSLSNWKQLSLDGGTDSGPAADPPPPKEPVMKFDDGAEQDTLISSLVERLGRCGVMLPEDTSKENFYERLNTALTALEGKQAAAAPPPTPPPDVEDPNDPEGLKKKKSPPVEEKRQMQMSLADIKDPFTRALAVRVTADDQAKRKSRIAGLRRRGLSPAIAKELETEASKVQFALGEDHKAIEPEIDRRLSLLETVLPDEEFTPAYLRRTSTTEPHPEGAGGSMNPDRVKEVRNAYARAAGVK